MPKPISLVRNLRFGANILASKVFSVNRPYQVQLSLTNRCNLRCSYCYADYPGRTDGDVPTDKIFSLLDEMASLGTVRVNLLGGEPLIRKDIGEIVDRTKRLGMQCAMTSNGAYVPKRLDTVQQLDLLAISLDGDRESHDAQRGIGSFDAAVEGVRLAKEVKTPVQVAAVLTARSIGSIGWLLNWAKEMDVSVGFSTLIPKTVDGAKQAFDDAPTEEQTREAIETIIRMKDEGYPVLFSRQTLGYARDWPLSYAVSRLPGPRPEFPIINCYAGRRYCIIDVNGDVFPCPTLVDDFAPKNAFAVGMAEAFAHAGRHDCQTCHIPCQNEFNLLYDLNPGAVLSIVRSYAAGGV